MLTSLGLAGVAGQAAPPIVSPDAVCARGRLPSDPLAIETSEAALQRGIGLSWRKPDLAAAVTPELWRSVRPAPLGALLPETRDLADGTPLRVSHETLLALLGERKTGAGHVVVAVRGARPQMVASGWAEGLELTAHAPDHHNFCCTIMLWNLASKAVAAFIGSTVPNRTAVVAAGLGVKSANMLKPGLFRYSTGSHSHYGTVGCGFGIPDSLRQNPRGGPIAKAPAWRPTRSDGFASARSSTTQDDNLHCAETPLLEPWDRFSSEGCMVVAGGYLPASGPTGPWAQFQTFLASDPRATRSVWLLHAGQLA